MNEQNTTFWGYLASSKGVRYLSVIILIIAALFLFAKTVAEFKSISYIGESMDVRNTITVSGSGEVSVIPDVAEFSFAVSHEAQSVAEAQERVSEEMNDLLDYLEEFGVEESDIRTTRYNVSPRYEYTEPSPYRKGSRTLAGYEVSQHVEVTLSETEGLGEVIGGLGSRGATNISNVRFTVEDEEAVRAEARRKAIEEAQEKADTLADDLGVRLGRVVNFHESGGPIIYREESFAVDGRGGADMASEPRIPSGENEITVNVNISYSIK